MPDPATDHTDPTPTAPVTLGRASAGLFALWRRTIATVIALPSRLGRATTRAARRWWSQWQAALRYHRQAPQAWQPAGSGDRAAAAALGLRGFVFGLIALAIITASDRNVWGPGIVAAGGEVLWAGMRFIIIALLMPRGAISRSNLSTAFLAGLLPHAFGLTWLLRLIALGASSALTYRGLCGAGVSRDDVRVVVMWAFGGQAAVLASGWLVRAIAALVVGL